MPPKHGDRVGDPLDLGGFPSGLTQGKSSANPDMGELQDLAILFKCLYNIIY